MKTVSYLVILLSFSALLAQDRVETDDQSGSILFRVDPDWATVSVDGVAFGEARRYDGKSAVLPVTPGTHTIKISAQGYLDYEKRVFINDSREVINIQLRKSGNAPYAGIPRRSTAVLGSLYGLVSPVNSTGDLLTGVGVTAEFSLNSQTDFIFKGETVIADPADSSLLHSFSIKLGPALTAFNGDLRPQYGILLGAQIPSDGDSRVHFLMEGILRGLYAFNSSVDFFMGIAPEVTFGNESAFHLNFSGGLRVRL